MKEIQISIIIVSYNCLPWLINTLESVIRALRGLDHEIIVIDNASTDGTIQMLRERYPSIKRIANTRNRGFAAANNQGLTLASGEYIVMLNPDTLVQEDTFSTLFQFMETHPHTGMVTCKILNADGSFARDARHSIPSPMTAFWKQIGFSRLFPHSPRFARYNLTYVNENETHRVDAISGSFMFIRERAVRDTGTLDEDYFMYCEDVDYCYRMGHIDWEIYYAPLTSIIHYKGESTHKNDYRYALNFNRSLYLFYDKHFHHKYFPLLKSLILTGVFLRGSITYSRQLAGSVFQFLHTSVFKGQLKHKKKRVLLVCSREEADGLSDKIRRLGYDLCSIVYPDGGRIAGPAVRAERVMTLEEMTEDKIIETVDEVIFSAANITYKKIIETISNPKLRKKNCRIIPPRTDLLLSKGEARNM